MPAYRCSLCNINYPTEVSFRVCPNCDDAISYFTNVESDSDWRKLLEMKRAGLAVPEKPTPVEPETDQATIIYDNVHDRVMVTHQQLLDMGYIPEPFDVVKMNGTYYELLDWQPNRTFWTIERIDVYKWLEELDEFTGEPYEGPSSDDIRQIEHKGIVLYWDPRKGPDPRGEA